MSVLFGGVATLDAEYCVYCLAVIAAGPCALHRDVDPREWHRAKRRALGIALEEGYRLWAELGSGA